jgi:hypothetical protein
LQYCAVFLAIASVQRASDTTSLKGFAIGNVPELALVEGKFGVEGNAGVST